MNELEMSLDVWVPPTRIDKYFTKMAIILPLKREKWDFQSILILICSLMHHCFHLLPFKQRNLPKRLIITIMNEFGEIYTLQIIELE